jgi:hypothetical protein
MNSRRGVPFAIVVAMGLTAFCTVIQARPVAGTVKDLKTSLGIPNVLVRILETGDSTRTNTFGFYAFPNVVDGSYTFFVGIDKYQPQTLGNTHIPNTCCLGKRGNVNCTGGIDASDLSSLVSYLTGGSFVPCCVDGANVNGTGGIDASDLSSLVSYLTGGTFVLLNCP